MKKINEKALGALRILINDRYTELQRKYLGNGNRMTIAAPYIARSREFDGLLKARREYSGLVTSLADNCPDMNSSAQEHAQRQKQINAAAKHFFRLLSKYGGKYKTFVTELGYDNPNFIICNDGDVTNSPLVRRLEQASRRQREDALAQAEQQLKEINRYLTVEIYLEDEPDFKRIAEKIAAVQ